jgi:hypothetical protein
MPMHVAYFDVEARLDKYRHTAAEYRLASQENILW